MTQKRILITGAAGFFAGAFFTGAAGFFAMGFFAAAGLDFALVTGGLLAIFLVVFLAAMADNVWKNEQILEIPEPLVQWKGRGGLALHLLYFKGKLHNP